MGKGVVITASAVGVAAVATAVSLGVSIFRSRRIDGFQERFGDGIRKLQSIVSRQPRSWYEELPLFTLKNALGMEVVISALGASIVKLIVPDAKGKKADVVLGYDSVEEYVVSSHARTDHACIIFTVISML